MSQDDDPKVTHLNLIKDDSDKKFEREISSFEFPVSAKAEILYQDAYVILSRITFQVGGYIGHEHVMIDLAEIGA